MNSNNRDEDNGFGEWGGYMATKKAKLADQFQKGTCHLTKQQSGIFNGVAILVNGYTKPSAEELKALMATHGGIYHHYQMPTTTHIIASILPDAKVKQLGSVPIVQANWISDSVLEGKVLDYRKYLLYTNQNQNQPVIGFPIVNKPHRTLTAADPRFLAEFYNNSRLHLISTLGAEYKQLVNQLREKCNGQFAGRDKLKALSRSNVAAVTQTVIMHIDMDCFFVSVGLRYKPNLRGQPVVVTHWKNSMHPIKRPEASVDAENELLRNHYPNEQWEIVDPHASMSEVACCSYEARQHGVRNGMLLGAALKLCPNLKAIPYDFNGYREVSTVLYRTLAQYTIDIEAVSCDEMYVDVTPILKDTGIDVEEWADHIRMVIMDSTGCPCSTGFGSNRLQARLATKKAKPAGKFYLRPEEANEYMSDVALADLPGVGHATVAKLKRMNLNKCSDLHMITLEQLQSELGMKIGETIMDFARGIDSKPLNFQHERKSISADVNYGIRFKNKVEALNFLQTLSTEVYNRLQDLRMRARCLNLKLLVRAPGAPQEPAKFLGCGVCNTINRSTTTGGLITDSATIYKEAKNLFERINVVPCELRGIGIQLTKLEKAPPTNSALKQLLQTCDKKENCEMKTEKVSKRLLPKPTRGRKGSKNVKVSAKAANNLHNYFKQETFVNDVPNVGDMDLNVLNELPLEVQQEIIEEYKLEGKIRVDLPKNDEPAQQKNTSNTNYFEKIQWTDLKPILINWLQSTSSPKEVDVQMLAEHLKNLAMDRKIEPLKATLSFLYRHISGLGSCSWHDAYYVIINMVQQGMVARYGSTLLVQSNFCCSVHF
ncbi:hypothetical protein FQA39_LY16968 [Lamprigera yunnana]|nr:hypothetical protein FQA39_LY16968 [Lamprigera yunnana]